MRIYNKFYSLRCLLLTGVLLNYQLVMKLLLWKASNCHILKTRTPNDKLFAHICSIEDSDLQKVQITTIFFFLFWSHELFEQSCDQNRKKINLKAI